MTDYYEKLPKKGVLFGVANLYRTILDDIDAVYLFGIQINDELYY